MGRKVQAAKVWFAVVVVEAVTHFLVVKPTLWCSSSIDRRANKGNSSTANYKSNYHFGVLPASIAEPHGKAQVLYCKLQVKQQPEVVTS